MVADLAAESGYFRFRIAPKIGRTGKELAVEIRDEVLETMLVGRGFPASNPVRPAEPGRQFPVWPLHGQAAPS